MFSIVFCCHRESEAERGVVIAQSLAQSARPITAEADTTLHHAVV